MKNKKGFFGKLLLILIVLALVWECFIFYNLYKNADEVECNFVWCKFKTTHIFKNESLICFMNGNETDCAGIEIPEEIKNKIKEIIG